MAKVKVLPKSHRQTRQQLDALEWNFKDIESP